jgi:uncharacterized protein (TIGR01777 family)
VRHAPRDAGEVEWDPQAGKLDPSAFHNIDVVINLNGATIAGHRWTRAYKQELIDSRVKPTELLASTMAQLDEPPAVFISFSGAGYYGYHSADTILDEDSSAGSTFLAQLAQQWEMAAEPARQAGIRVVHPRLGVVIGKGGMLAKLLPVFRAGLGARLGSGQQSFSWIALHDIGPALLHCIEHGLDGPVNFTAPHAVTSAQFTRLLSSALQRPALLAVPGFALRLVTGEVADELLNGANVAPRRLVESGYEFALPSLSEALARYIPRK